MTPKRFWGTVFAVWGVLMVTDWFFHGHWMKTMYEQTQQFWRSPGEMQKMIPIMWFGSFVYSWAFVWIWKQGLSKANPWGQAFRFGLAIFLLSSLPTQVMHWVTAPYPGELVIRWGFIGMVQAFACSFVLTWVAKPKTVWSH